MSIQARIGTKACLPSKWHCVPFMTLTPKMAGGVVTGGIQGSAEDKDNTSKVWEQIGYPALSPSVRGVPERGRDETDFSARESGAVEGSPSRTKQKHGSG